MPEKLTVVLVEGSFIVQTGIEQLLQEFPELELVQVFDGNEKMLDEKITGLHPDFVVIDPSTFNNDLVALTNRLAESGSCLIGITTKNTAININSRFKYLLKLNAGKYELLEELKKITGNKSSKLKNESPTELSERETTILKLVVIGLTNQEIADKLYLSIHTVTTHRKNITRKLGIKTLSGLTVYALMNKLVQIEEIKKK